MSEEVRYQMLRPGQVVERRKACPVVYIPIGTIEWHGLHNPLGADTLQADGLAVLAAQKGGGLVFPPLYYGESRSESLMDAVAPDMDKIAACMELPPANFAPDRQPFSPMQQVLNYQGLLLHILAEAESLGFQLAVIVCGHYPLIDHARAAVLLFNKRRYSRYHGMLAWATLDYLLVNDKYDFAGDHAGGWETSHLMHLHPETVDLSVLPPKGEKLIGAGGKLAPQDSTAELGRRSLEDAADVLVKEVHHRLANPQMYKGHGICLREGLWREKKE